MSEETITVGFVLTAEQKKCLKEWAKKEDRSVSYIIRQILDEEIKRRTAQLQPEPTR